MAIKTLKHGGDLQAAEQEFGRPESGWLDLSTGISPWQYPVGQLPDSVWHKLPYADAALLTAAADYYQCPEDRITPVAGSQDAIRRLPAYLPPARVALPANGYREHLLAWRSAGHQVVRYASQDELRSLSDRQLVEHIVIINPNNPTAEIMDTDFCLQLTGQLPQAGYLLIDEAFMDCHPEKSFIPKLNNTNVLVLRSVGKFFGLAGLRLGFVLGQGELVEQLRADTQPWGVSHPAIFLGAKALSDVDWQRQQIQRVEQQQQYLQELLGYYFPDHERVSTSLFSSLFDRTVSDRESLLHSLYIKAAKSGILLRYGELAEGGIWLRVGLPGENMPRLEQFLNRFKYV